MPRRVRKGIYFPRWPCLQCMYIVNLPHQALRKVPFTASSSAAHTVLAGRNLGVPMVLGIIGRKLDDLRPGAVLPVDGTAGTVQAGRARPRGALAGGHGGRGLRRGRPAARRAAAVGYLADLPVYPPVTVRIGAATSDSSARNIARGAVETYVALRAKRSSCCSRIIPLQRTAPSGCWGWLRGA